MTAVLALLAVALSPEAPRRIVTLAPSCAEIVSALGLEDRIVGVTDFTDWPERVKPLPRVGSYVSFSIEAVAALHPDLVVATDDGNPPAALRRIERLGIRVETLRLRGYRDIEHAIELLGTAVGRAAQAQRVVAEMDRVARCVAVRTKDVPRPRVLFAYEVSPIVSAGRGTLTDEIVAMAGGISVTHDVATEYPRLNAESVIARAPEVVIVSSMNPALDTTRWRAWMARWPSIPAVATGRVHVIESTNVDRPSQRVVLGLTLLARTIHPVLFAHGECDAAAP